MGRLQVRNTAVKMEIVTDTLRNMALFCLNLIALVSSSEFRLLLLGVVPLFRSRYATLSRKPPNTIRDMRTVSISNVAIWMSHPCVTK